VHGQDWWLRAVDIQPRPDGALYIADFSNPHISHLRHHEGQIVHESGRIYRLTARDLQPQAPFDLSKKSTAELIEVLRSENRWMREMALRILGHRKDKIAIPILQELLIQRKGALDVHALWGLNLMCGFNE